MPVVHCTPPCATPRPIAAVTAAPHKSSTPNRSAATTNDSLTVTFTAKSAFNERIYNEFSPGLRTDIIPFSIPSIATYAGEVSVGLKKGASSWLVRYRYDQFQYQHLSNFLRAPPGYCPDKLDPGCVTVIGAQFYDTHFGFGQGYVPSFIATEHYATLDAMGKACALWACPYVGLSYMEKQSVYYRYPLIDGVGLAAAYLPSPGHRFSAFASAGYYPFVSGIYDGPVGPQFGVFSGKQLTLAYSIVRYDVGVSVRTFGPVYVQIGQAGIFGTARDDSPVSYALLANYAGLSVILQH